MMVRYSAGAVSRPFWFSEFRQVLDWYLDGQTWEDIRSVIVEQNYFMLPGNTRRITLFGAMSRRINSLSPAVQTLMSRLDPENQRVISLVSLMNTELLVKSFMTRVYREELLLGDMKVEPYEMQSFFRGLQTEDADVARWTDQTVARLTSMIRNYLIEAGLAKDDDGDLILTRLLLDPRLEDALSAAGHQDYVLALTGR